MEKKVSRHRTEKLFSVESAIEGFCCGGAKNPRQGFDCVCGGKISPRFSTILEADKKCEKHERNLFSRAPRPPSLYAEGKCLQSFEIHYGGVSTSLCQPHIFLPFSIITFLSLSLFLSHFGLCVCGNSSPCTTSTFFHKHKKNSPFNNFSFTF